MNFYNTIAIEIFGYLSGLAILISFLPYIRDIFSGKTKPERISWLIWAGLGLISLFSQFAKGASYSLIMTGAQAVGDLFIFLLAIKYGLGGFLKRDIAALIGAGLGLFLWYITKEAAVALFIVIFVDAIGVVLTVIKSYEKPKTETISAWVFTFIGGFLGCLAVGGFNFILLVFPFYICLASLSILLAIKLGLKHNKSASS
ncbi:MAG: hypothetical protein WC619_03380 [Patescibacteria group bacterium]